jgi:RimJ/RimL family protein N-acetyltransferase
MSATPKKKRATKRRAPTHPTPKPAQKPIRARAPVDPKDITIVRTRGTKGRGAGPKGEAWRIEFAGKRAGVVFTNWIDEPPVGAHASIQIYLNATSQGRRIGRVAYRLACEASAYDTIYAHMRKSNIASRRAAEEAGFVEAVYPGVTQLIMVRRRSTR